MAGAPGRRGAPLPLVLCLLPGCLLPAPAAANGTCGAGNCTFPPAPAPARVTPAPVLVEKHQPTAGRCRAGGSAVVVEAGPTSRTATVGDRVSLECVFSAPEAATVTWNRVCPRKNCSSAFAPVGTSPGNRSVLLQPDRATLDFHHVDLRDAGLYFCRVEAGRAAGQSCGTYLRVRNPVAVPFLNLRESTKNRIITAEGILLLLCAVGPGLFLLFRKRWANERLLQIKKSAYEEENLYEGLNLDECSMYEDISRGLQPTYQDVGSLCGGDAQLEKP
ncbi:B-cell antigen receptor complex-associated protein alpha chain isoform X1 [Dromaius novaehollandiae]|uniref:B-cell antigen receptor complex-associated protein alpha chain isoform X1 n=1 Tax=Dromaius novaehollandiae TaxID=8790 RepID=UPI00311F3821